MSDYPTPMLRPVYELPVAVAHGAGAVLVAGMPPQFWNLPGYFCLAIAGVLAAGACWRGWQAWRVARYQRLLTRRSARTVRATPVDDRRLFIGYGYEWRQMHIQRLKEARRPEALRYVQAPDDEGGDPILHGVGMLEGERKVWLSLVERTGHMLVLGATRVGKTTLLQLLVGQDIARGDTVVVLDPKGDPDLLRRIYHESKKAGRLHQLRIFHLRHPEVSVSYNPIAAYTSPSEIAGRIAEQLPTGGDSTAFKEFGWRFVNTIVQALDALGRKPTYIVMSKYLQDINPLVVDYLTMVFDRMGLEEWRKKVEGTLAKQVAEYADGEKKGRRRERPALAGVMLAFARKRDINDEIANDLAGVFSYDRVYYEKLIASLMPLLARLKSGRIAGILNPDPTDLRALNWADSIRAGHIVYVGLDALANPSIARSVGNAMFADLASTAGSAYAEIDTERTGGGRRISIHADEFNDIVGPHLHPILSKAGGAGVQMTAYTQTLADIEASLGGGRAEAARITGNFNSLIMLRVRTIDTARMLSEQSPAFDVIELAESASSADSSQAQTDVAFTSSSSERISTKSVHGIEPADLMRLPKGEAFALLGGGKIWKLRVPMFREPVEELSVPAIMRAVR